MNHDPLTIISDDGTVVARLPADPSAAPPPRQLDNPPSEAIEGLRADIATIGDKMDSDPLLKAAPFMLAALKCVADELNSAPEQGRWLGEMVRSAIAKAEGKEG